jgi:hypothetical protein
MRAAGVPLILACLAASAACLPSPGLLDVPDREPLYLVPSAPTVPPLGAITFGASGGSGEGYLFSLVVNASGGTLSEDAGTFVAGARGNVADVIQVEDSQGGLAQATVLVGPGVSIRPYGVVTGPGGGPVPFTASGGSGTGWSWSLVRNESGGRVDPVLGQYFSGPTEGVYDLVQATDALGNVATARIDVAYVIVLPWSVTLVAGATQTFFAGVHFTGDLDVSWTVVEPGGGTITWTAPPSAPSLASCGYAAPAVPGTYHVQAASLVDPTKYARAEVVVVAPP